MAGPNLEVFKFGMYIMFPIGIMFYYGHNLDKRFQVPDFWPKAEQTHKIPFERDEIKSELDRLRAKRLYLREQRLKKEQALRQEQEMHCMDGIGVYGQRIASQSSQNGNCCNGMMYELLEPVPVEAPPIYSVNRDARGVVLSWAHKKAIGIYFCKEKRKHVFGPRVFDDGKDTLCVELDSYPDFCSEPSRRPSDPDFPELKYPPGSGPSLRRIAIPKHLFTFAVNSGSGMLVHHMLREIFEWFPSIEEIIIIVNAHGCMKAHQRWELGNAHGKAFIYDQKRRLYSWDDGESICDEAIYKLIEKATEGLSQAFKPDAAIAFHDALDVAKGASLGTNFTLCCPYTLLAHFSELEWAAKFGVVEHLVRISVDVVDLEILASIVQRALDVAADSLMK
ncbi:hypothetical protein V495_00514 [Pseudogymnoascus sp. VKM F-4514 (FW-929)]|nr:hypothetical protein V495_00514 [Pseudogymnoascus sp. VKM F-4514 (FW-929)]